MLNKTRVVLGSAVALLALTACNEKTTGTAASAPAASASAVAAKVNGTAISQKQLDQIMKQQAAQGMPDNAETRKMVIDNLAMQLIVAQAASAKGMDKSPEVVEQIENIKQSVLANAYVKDFMKNNAVSDEALKAEYDSFKAQQNGKEYKARHILVSGEDEAKEIIAKLKKDAKAFDGLAKAKSKDPGSKERGGDLGWFDPRGMVPEFGAAVAKLEKGHFTQEPVKSQFGYHVIMLEDSRPVAIATLDEMKAGLSQQIQQKNLQKMLADLKAKATIEIIAPANAPTAAAPALTAPAAGAAAASAASK